MNPVASILSEIGPSRSSTIVKALQQKLGINESAARKQLSRSRPPIRKFPVPLLPNRESFVYLEDQRNSDDFYDALHNALRETNSIYGIALDGFLARGGIAEKSEFSVISGAPVAMRKQVSSEAVAQKLISAGYIKEATYDGIEYYQLKALYHSAPSFSEYEIRILIEKVLLDGLKDWCKKLGLVSWDKVQIRGDDAPRKVGQFIWDITAPSYLLPVRRNNHPGFLVADLFSDRVLTDHEIRFFIRKVDLLKSSTKNINILPLLFAQGFDKAATQLGKSKGVILATPLTLFGKNIASAIDDLFQTLRKVTETATGNPQKVISLIKSLSSIEGAVGNLRGVLFELLSIYLAKFGAVSIDYSKRIYSSKHQEHAEIDIFRVVDKSKCVCIECKGKGPGGSVSLPEIEKWLQKVKVMHDFLSTQENTQNSKKSYEIWTTGTFTDDALVKLKEEKEKRKKAPIDWKDGSQMVSLARAKQETAIVDILNEHFVRHPLS